MDAISIMSYRYSSQCTLHHTRTINETTCKYKQNKEMSHSYYYDPIGPPIYPASFLLSSDVQSCPSRRFESNCVKHLLVTMSPCERKSIRLATLCMTRVQITTHLQQVLERAVPESIRQTSSKCFPRSGVIAQAEIASDL